MPDDQAETAIISSGIWRHVKGYHYLVLGLASDSNNVSPHAEPQVVYVSIDVGGRMSSPMHVRSLQEFLDRFEPVENGRNGQPHE